MDWVLQNRRREIQKLIRTHSLMSCEEFSKMPLVLKLHWLYKYKYKLTWSTNSWCSIIDHSWMDAAPELDQILSPRDCSAYAPWWSSALCRTTASSYQQQSWHFATLTSNHPSHPRPSTDSLSNLIIFSDFEKRILKTLNWAEEEGCQQDAPSSSFARNWSVTRASVAAW